MFPLCFLALLGIATSANMTFKRGLIGVDNVHSFQDQPTLLNATALSWAMNYQSLPGNASWFGNLEFVPQFWGSSGGEDFRSNVLASLSTVKHVYAFNEPDGTGPGQSNISPSDAAALWLQYVQPLKASNISLGSPACTGTNEGIQWLEEFYGNCTTCTIDFITTHWYGSFEGLAAHLGNLHQTFNATPMWVTELGIDYASVPDTQYMYNTSINWLDGLSWVDRYAWFGSFRSIDSNIGPNATMLNATGGLTEIGENYLYQLPAKFSSSGPAAATTSSRTSAGRKSVQADLRHWRMALAMVVAIGLALI